MAEQAPQNHVFNHVALSVCDIEAVIEWYTKIFGFKLVGGIRHTKRSEQPDAKVFTIYPPSLQEFKSAWLITGNGVGYEVFEFINPKAEPQTQSFEYQKTGFFHICVTAPDPDVLAAKVESAGGKRIGGTVDSLGNGSKCLYAQDPWGNVVEIMSISFEQLAYTRAALAAK